MGLQAGGTTRGRRASTSVLQGMAGAALALGVVAAMGPGAASAATRPGVAAARAPQQVHLGAPALGAARPEGRLPHLAKPHAEATRTFVVTTNADSPLASTTLKVCRDAAGGKCSLRAAVLAANNLDTPVLIKLGPHTYTLTDTTDGTIVDTNAGGTTIEGVSMHGSIISAPSSFTYTALSVGDNAHDQGASLTLEDLTVSGGSGSDGGAIAAQGGNVGLVLDAAEVTHGSADDGGGVYCDDASVWATDSSISGNVASAHGGGLYLYYCVAYLTRTNVNSDVVTDATVGTDGGGIFQEYGLAHLLDASVSNDTAGSATEAGEGGGLYTYYASTDLTRTTVSHDTAKTDGEGGGAFVYYGVLDGLADTFRIDRAAGTESYGGAVMLDYGADATFHDTVVEHDSTGSTEDDEGGGGFYLFGYEAPSSLTLDDHSTISDNQTGAIVTYQYYAGSTITVDNSVMKGNTSSLEGAGGIYAYVYYGGGSLTLDHDVIDSNADAAGSYAAGGVYTYAEYGAETVEMTGTQLKGNVGSGKDSMGGVGFYTYYGSVSLTATSCQFLDNRAPDVGWGGGVGLYDDEGSEALLALTRDVIEGNVSGSSSAAKAGDGGGIYLYDYATLHLTDSVVAHNSALGGGSSSGAGGGIFDESYMGASYAGDTITANKATGPASYGGGVFDEPYYGGTRMLQTTVSDNAAVDGAGLYISYYSFQLDQSTIAGNVAGSPGAEGSGGGIYAYDNRLDIANSTITQNRAATGAGKAGEGGGIFNYDAEVSLYYATLAGNVAPSGAGIYEDDGYGTLRDSILASNHPTLAAKAEQDCKQNVHADTLTSLGGNVIAQGGCVTARTSSDVVTARPGLSALAANGGPTRTMALAASSPAVDLAHGDCLPTDQRGVPRPTAGTCDAGAYQLAARPRAKPH